MHIKDAVPPGTLYVIAAPSGAGKTSLVKALLNSIDNVAVSVSHTTRKKRPGEQEGVDYHFVDSVAFEAMVADQQFIEHAKVFDNYYGTSRANIIEQLRGGLDVILEIDWQGARQVRELMSDCVSVFILPPSRAALEMRLQGRGQDSPEIIARRMADAVNEMSHWDEFDYLVVNDDFDHALEDLRAILLSRRLRREVQRVRHGQVIRELLA